MTVAPRAMAVMLPLPLAGWSGWQSALDPHGPQAEYLAQLIWGFTVLCTVIWLLVMITLWFAIWRRNRTARDFLVQDRAADKR